MDLAQSRKYYSTLFFGAVAVAVSVAVLFVAGLLVMPPSVLSRNLQYLLLITAALIITRSLQPTLIGFLRAEGKTMTFNIVEVSVRAATVLLACALLLTWKHNLTVLFSVTLLVESLAIVVLCWYLRQRDLLYWSAVDWSYFRIAAIFAFPLIGYELSSVILDSGDRLLVQRFLGAEQLGYYSAAYNISTYVEESLMVPINLALFPIYMKIWVEKGKEETQQFLSRSLNNFLALAVAIVCVVFLTSRDVVVVLASRKFQEAHHLLPILVIGLLIYAVHIFLNAALLIHRRTTTMTALVIYACVANLLMNLVLIPRMGIQGAAVATLLSYLLLVILMGRVSFRLLPLQIGYAAFLANLIAAAITYGVVSRITIEKALPSAMVKGSLGLILYGTLACILNPVVRAQVMGRIRAARREKS